MWEPFVTVGLAVWTCMQLAASPIHLHLLACRVAGSARFRRCGAGVDEDIARAVLECSQFAKSCYSAPADVTRPAAPAAPRRGTNKLLSGAHRWTYAMITLHIAPAGLHAALAIAYPNHWARGAPAGALPCQWYSRVALPYLRRDRPHDLETMLQRPYDWIGFTWYSIFNTRQR